MALLIGRGLAGHVGTHSLLHPDHQNCAVKDFGVWPFSSHTSGPPQQLAAVIRAYLHRWNRQPGSRAMASEGRHYVGVSADASLEEIQGVAERYPVLRIQYEGHADTRRGGPK